MLRRTQLLIMDVTRPRCSELLEAALCRVSRVLEATVDWQTGRTQVRHEDRRGTAGLVRAVEETSLDTPHHYRARVVQEEVKVCGSGRRSRLSESAMSRHGSMA